MKDINSDPVHLSKSFRQVAHGIDRIMREALTGMPLTPQTYDILKHLADNKAAKIKDLQKQYIGINITYSLKILADKGFIETQESFVDRRSIVCSMTPKGTRLFEKADRAMRGMFKKSGLDAALVESDPVQALRLENKVAAIAARYK